MIINEVTSKPFPLFKDVFGLQEIIDELTRLITFVNGSANHKNQHLILPRGILLHGQPGTGKTFLVRALVNELKLNYIHVSAQDSRKKAINDLENSFKEARKNAPSVIFIDELDSFIEANEFDMPDTRIINKLLNLMDGFEPYEGVIVIAATTKFNIIPDYLLRAGRFDRKYHVNLPDLEALENAVKRVISTLGIKTEVSIKTLPSMFVGMTIAEVKSILNEIYLSHRLDKNPLTLNHVVDGIEKYRIGLHSINQVYSGDVKKRIAIHEIAHAFFHQKYNGIEQLVRISLIKRENAHGHILVSGNSRQMAVSKSAIENEIMILLAGHAAEVAFFNEATSGGATDLEMATYMAYEMVSHFGMSRLTPRIYTMGEQINPMHIGNKILDKADAETSRIIDRLYKRTLKTIRKNRKTIERIATILEEKLTLSNEEFKQLLDTK